MSKHTPGPWEVIWANDESYCEHTGPFGATTLMLKIGDTALKIALFTSPGFDHDKFVKWEANARLMAAAPEMYDALQKANEFIQNGIELGYIHMPDKDCPDPAHLTPKIIQRALAKADILG